MTNLKDIGFFESQTALRVIRKEMNIAEAASSIGASKLEKALKYNAAPSDMINRVKNFNAGKSHPTLKRLAAKAPSFNPYKD